MLYTDHTASLVHASLALLRKHFLCKKKKWICFILSLGSTVCLLLRSTGTLMSKQFTTWICCFSGTLRFPILMLGLPSELQIGNGLLRLHLLAGCSRATCPMLQLSLCAPEPCGSMPASVGNRWWLDSLSNVVNSVLKGMLEALDDYKM